VPSGILLVDKPAEWTSHDVVARVRRLAQTRKVGHAGTLDPMATGVLVLGVGSATRLLTYVVGADKEYHATIRLGSSTTTDDAEGEELTRAPMDALAAVTAGAIAEGIAALTGEIDQVPSSVSAIKVDGKRAYARVRGGEEVALAARTVTVGEFELISCDDHGATGGDGIDLAVRVVCSSGTYIRALARDLGSALGVGGHLTRLRRTRVGSFGIDRSEPLESLVVADRLVSAADAATELFGAIALTEQQSIDLGHGKRIVRSETQASTAQGGGPLAAIAPDGRLIGLVEFRGSEGRSLVNFPADQVAEDGS
jgi:tRNA pseudouridine55 synthase